jgi:hypothetical protein
LELGFEELGFEELGFEELGFEELGFEELGFEEADAAGEASGSPRATCRPALSGASPALGVPSLEGSPQAVAVRRAIRRGTSRKESGPRGNDIAPESTGV